MKLQCLVEEKAGKRELSYDFRGIILCGYTGRDQTAVRKHIAELKKIGVEPPPTVPTFYPKPPQGIVIERDIHVGGKETSGEVEYALLMDGDHIYVGVGSDHTDRELEKIDILKSKQLCPTILSETLWNYNEIKDHWDHIQIRSWAVIAGKRTLYQEATLATILSPDVLMRFAQDKIKGSLEGIALFSGTPSLLAEEMVFADSFKAELQEPILQRKLTIAYSIHTLTWFKD